MQIALLRHGKPNIPASDRLYASTFGEWIRAYDASGLSALSRPTNEALALTGECNAIICSNLPRSIESANALNSAKVVLSDSIFNEAGLPSAGWRKIKLSPNLWAGFFRILWLFGYSCNSESLDQTKARAKKAVKLLAEIATEHENIVFVGHGVYNRLLASELRRSGWMGPKNPGSKYWSYGVYKR